MKLIVYSEELAKQDLSGHINSLIGNVAIRPKTTVALCKGKAKEFLKNIKPNLEASPARYYELLFESHEYTDDTIESELINFYSAASALDEDTTVIILSNTSEEETESSTRSEDTNKEQTSKSPNDMEQTGKNKSENSESSSSNKSKDSENSEKKSESESQNQENENSENSSSNKGKNSESKKEDSKTTFVGIAAFDGAKMVGTIPEDLVISHLILSSSLKTGNINVQDVKDESKLVSLNIRQEKDCKFDVEIDKNQYSNPEINININVKLTGKLQSANSTTNYLERENKNKLKESAEKHIENKLNEYIKLTQEYNTDITGIGKHVKKEYLTWKEFERANWNENYKNAKINVKVDLDINVSRVISHTVPNK